LDVSHKFCGLSGAYEYIISYLDEGALTLKEKYLNRLKILTNKEILQYVRIFNYLGCQIW